MRRIVPAFAILFAAGIFFGYVNPLWNGKIASTKAAIAQDDQALAAASEYQKRESELAAERNAIDPDALAKLERFLPDSVNNIGLILDLDALATRTGLALSSINVASARGSAENQSSSASPTNPVGSIDLTLNAKGTYAALEEFLKGVEQSERLLDVRELVVEGSSSGVYNYQLTARLYWLR